MRRLHLWILLTTLLAFGLRLYAIDRQDIWGDEAFSIWLSSRPLSEVVAGGADTHPPLYPFLLFVWLRLAGLSPLAVRLLSAGIGTLTVPVLYGLGRHVFGRPTAVVAALLAAVSPVLVYYSQETRMYGLVVLFSALSVYWTARLLGNGSKPEPGPHLSWPFVAYILTTLGAVYTHYYAFFVILAENLVLIIAFWRGRRWTELARWLVAQGLIGLAYVPWILVQTGFLGGKASTRFEEWDLASALRIFGQTLGAFGAGLAVPPAGVWVVTAVFVVVMVAGLPVLIRRRQAAPWLIVAYFLLPLGLAWLVNPIMPFFYARYLLLIAPAFYLLSGWGALAWGRVWRPLTVASIVLLLTGSVYGLSSYYTDEVYVRGRYGQMMAYIEENAQPGDGLILANQLQRPLFQYYQPEGLKAHYFPRLEYPLEDARTIRDLAEIAARHPRLWLVRFGNPAEYDPSGTLVRWLATQGSKAYFDGWGDADLSLYVMAPAGVGDTIPNPLHLELGEHIRLLGFALGSQQVAPGGTLLLTLYWQAQSPIQERYTVFTHLLDQDGQIQAQVDSEPQGGGFPTDQWAVGDIVTDNYALTVAENTSGTHVLEVGMYLLETLDRLPVHDLDTGALLGDRVLLESIEVAAP
jgi:hypothetical protein